MRLEIETNPSTFTDNVIADAAAESHASESKEALREGIKAAQSGNRINARVALFRAAELDPKSESAWLWLASISEYPEELLVFLNNVLDINPLNARATEWMAATKSLLSKTFVQRGIDAVQEGRADFAAQCFNQALEHEQNNAMAWLWMASLSDSNEGKMSYLEKVLEIEPENDAALTAYKVAKDDINQRLLAEARTAAVEGRKSDSNELLDAFIAENPDSEDGWILRSHLADSFDEKIAAFEKVLSINPENLSAKGGLESLRAIMQTVAPKVEIVEQNENTSLALNAERQHESEVVPDKNPTQELVFPEAALEMLASHDEETVSGEEIVYFDSPVEPETNIVEQPQPAEPAAEPERDWLMNTSILKFEIPEKTQAAPIPLVKEQPEANENPIDLTMTGYIPKFDPASVGDDDALFESVSFAPEQGESFAAEVQAVEFAPEQVASFTPELVEEASEEPAPIAAPFDSFAETFSINGFDHGPVFEPKMEDLADFVSAENQQPLFESHDFAPIEETLSPFDQSIPMPPVELTDTSEFAKPTGFETTFVPRENGYQSSAAFSVCPFCNAENPSQAFACSSCLAMLTLSDLEMLLANTHADKLTLRESVERMEAERAAREFSECEITTLGIGHLNLRNFQTGYEYLQEASQLNPNNVVLASQVNALLIRLEEIKRQEEMHDSMPRGKKILVVDDSPTVRKLIAGKLEKCGHDVYCSADGVEAMEHIQLMIPDLVLLDITMPRMDGYQVCKLIRGNEATKNVPVIMISGKDGFFDKVRGRMAGTSGYITKPFGPETLMKAVETHLKSEAE